MADLKFDTGQGRDTVAKLSTCASNLEQELNTAKASVDGLVGSAWVAPAANQFQQQFEEFAGQVRQTIEHLHSLQQRLNSEIDQWEATGGSF